MARRRRALNTYYRPIRHSVGPMLEQFIYQDGELRYAD
jgi:hypothetical protein